MSFVCLAPAKHFAGARSGSSVNANPLSAQLQPKPVSSVSLMCGLPGLDRTGTQQPPPGVWAGPAGN